MGSGQAVNLKNYTTEVPTSTTIFRVQQFLMKAGVSQLAMDYGLDGSVSAITFSLQLEAKKRPVMVRLPANVDGALEALWRQRCEGGRLNSDRDICTYKNGKWLKKESLREHASRVAWRLVQDWIEVQLSMVAMKQADFLQVFLPYAWDGRQTFYDRLKGGGFKLLEAPKQEGEVVEAR